MTDPHFDGETYEAEHDHERLGTLLQSVRDHMLGHGEWRTLAEITAAVAASSEASVSARLRDLRKGKFGAYIVERQRRGDPADGIHEYRVRARLALVDGVMRAEVSTKPPELRNGKACLDALRAYVVTARKAGVSPPEDVIRLGRWLAERYGDD
jgi:hypothetical protein